MNMLGSYYGKATNFCMDELCKSSTSHINLYFYRAMLLCIKH